MHRFIFLFLCVFISINTLSTFCFSFSKDTQHEYVLISKIDNTTAVHSTTRQFQRKVFYVGNQFYVFYSNGVDACYKVSKDGSSWSFPMIVDKGVTSSSSIDVIYKDNLFYYFSSLYGDPKPDKSKMYLYARKGKINDQIIKWDEVYRVFKGTAKNEVFFYSTASLDPDGFFWIASRHGVPKRGFADVVVTRSIQPLDLKKWTPGKAGLKNTDKKSLGSQIIGLGDGKAYIMSKATYKGKFFGNFYDGTKWMDHDSLIAKGTTVPGDDKRMSMVFEPGNTHTKGRIHLVYIDSKNHLRYRILSAPYREQDWSPPLDQLGTLVVKDSKGHPVQTFTSVLAIDRVQQPATVYLLYGKTKFQGKDPRTILGELRLIRHANGNWSDRSILMSEVGTKYNWYPNMIQDANEKICIMYLKSSKRSNEIMFSSIGKSKADEYFDTSY